MPSSTPTAMTAGCSSASRQSSGTATTGAYARAATPLVTERVGRWCLWCIRWCCSTIKPAFLLSATRAGTTASWMISVLTEMSPPVSLRIPCSHSMRKSVPYLRKAPSSTRQVDRSLSGRATMGRSGHREVNVASTAARLSDGEVHGRLVVLAGADTHHDLVRFDVQHGRLLRLGRHTSDGSEVCGRCAVTSTGLPACSRTSSDSSVGSIGRWHHLDGAVTLAQECASGSPEMAEWEASVPPGQEQQVRLAQRRPGERELVDRERPGSRPAPRGRRPAAHSGCFRSCGVRGRPIRLRRRAR